MQSKTLFFSPTYEDIKHYESTALQIYPILASAQAQSIDSQKLYEAQNSDKNKFFFSFEKLTSSLLSSRSDIYRYYYG